eukprot:g11424.t1
MGAVPPESDSSSDESSQDNIEVDFGQELADSPPSSQTSVIDLRPGVDMMNGTHGKTSGSALQTKASANVAAGRVLERHPVDNAFGIAYKPCDAPSKQGYELPAGPAFVDEDEFEQDLGAEFRVVLGPSGGSAETPLSSSTARSENVSSKIDVGIDDFSDDERNDCKPKKLQKVPESSTTTAASSGDLVVPDGNSSRLPAHAAEAPLSSSGMELDNQEALKSLTEEYSRAESALQNPDNSSLQDQSANDIGGGHNESGTAAVVGVRVHLGGDVRQYPVMEEEGEEHEGGEDNEEVVEKPGTTTTPKVQRQGQEQHQTSNDNEDDTSRRARVIREWEAIDELRTEENSVPMEEGVGGAMQPISIDEDKCIATTDEVLRYFHSQDLAVYKNDIIPFQPPETRFGLFRRAPKLKFLDGEKLRDDVFLFAQVLSLLETQQAFSMVLYRLSLADVTGWPFLCVSIGFTKGAVGVLRRGSCYAECNRRERVLDVVNELHQAQFYGFMELCRKEPAKHHALHLAKIRAGIDKDSRALVKAYRAYLSREKAKSALGVVEKTGGGAAEEGLVDFPARKIAEEQRMKLRFATNRKNQYATDA